MLAALKLNGKQTEVVERKDQEEVVEQTEVVERKGQEEVVEQTEVVERKDQEEVVMPWEQEMEIYTVETTQDSCMSGEFSHSPITKCMHCN